MKKTTSFLILTASFLQIFFPFHQAFAATINATLSDSSLEPGQVVRLTGSDFGDTPINGQICFGDTVCSTTDTFRDIVTHWSNTSIDIQVPYAALPNSQIVHIYSGTNEIQAPYTYDQKVPEIISASPKQVSAEETIITINGQNLRNLATGADICINNSCILDEYLSSYVLSWSQTSIQLKVPFVSDISTFSLRIGVPIYRTVSGNVIQETLIIPGFSYVVGANPVITSVSPTTVVPGQTLISIKGSGFEDSYKPGWHSLCFNRMCLTDQSAAQYIQSWSNNEVVFILPKEFSVASTLSVSLFLRFPSENVYREVIANQSLTLEPLPVIERYTMDTTTGGGALFVGRNFGNTPGTVRLGSASLQVIEWTDTRIEAFIPAEASSGEAIIRTFDGKESIGVYLQVTSTATYSNDLYSSEQWYFPVMKMKQAWQRANLQSPITVAILDSGVDFSHEDLQGKSWINTDEIPANGIDDDSNGFVDDAYGWNFINDTNDNSTVHEHGTMVASTIVAEKDNLLGFAGVAPNARIMNLVVTNAPTNGDEPTIPFDAAQKAIKYAVDNGAKIINLSFSGATQAPLYSDVLDYAYKHNVLVVAAAGNNSTNLASQKHSPICDEGASNQVLGVSSVGTTLQTSTFANYGGCIDVFAPGEDIFVAVPTSTGSDYAYASGTSFAAPLISGIAALVWTTHPDWNVEEVKTALISSTVLTNGLFLLDAEKALTAAKPTVNYTPAPDAEVKLKNNPTVIELETPKVDPITEEPSAPATPRFPDVPVGYIYFDAIEYLAAKGIIQGYPSGVFAPERAINRAEFLKIVLEARGFTNTGELSNCFSDVTTDWYAPYVCYAKRQGYIEGYPDASKPRSEWSFRPDQTINKVEAIKILLTVFGEAPLSTGSTFRDVPADAWYTPYVAKAESLGLLMEHGLLYPAENMTRGKISEITYRLLYIREKNLPRF